MGREDLMLNRSNIYFFLIVIYCLSCCQIKNKSTSVKGLEVSKNTNSVDVPELSSHMDTCADESIRSIALNTFHYYISKEDQEKLCQVLYESAYYLDDASLVENEVVKDTKDEREPAYQYFSNKARLTIGFVCAATLVSIIISYELYRRISTKKSDGNANIESIVKRLYEAREDFKNNQNAKKFRENLEVIWKLIFPFSNSKSWLLKAEILDEVDELARKYPDIKPIAALSVKDLPNNEIKGHFVPLVDLSDAGYFAEKMSTFDKMTDQELADLDIKRSDLANINNKQLISLLEGEQKE